MQNQQHSDEGSGLSSFCDKELILQTLAIGTRDSEAFSAFESESDNEHNILSKYQSSHTTLDEPKDNKHNVPSNYQSSHDTPDDLEEDGSEHEPTPESETTLPTPPAHEINQG